MNNKRKCKVVMLPTNKKSDLRIVRGYDGNALCYDPLMNPTQIYNNKNHTLSYHHLYIISDEEIKEGDWCYNSKRKSIELGKYMIGTNEFIFCKKIITTTDTSLISINEQYFDVNKSRKSAVLEQKTLPQPSQEFIRQYIEEYNKGNVISNVEVEYEVDKYDIRNQYKHTPSGKYHDDEPIPPSPDRLFSNPSYFIPKINSDNTINIKSIKNSWSREEVINLLDDFNTTGKFSDPYKNKIEFDKWIEENL